MKPRLPNRIAIHIIAAASIALTAALALASAATAQTLSDPRPSPKWPPPPKAEKAHAAARVKTCAAYGAGFVQVPDTGTCIKVGGFVESTVSGGH